MSNRDKDAEKLRLQRGDKFRLLFESVADALFLHDLKGRFVEVNQAACDSLGYTREELLQLPFSNIVTNGEPKALGELWARVLHGEKLTVQGFHQRRDGTTFPVEVNLSPFEYEGRPHILASARDITERRRVEQELLHIKFAVDNVSDAIGMATKDGQHFYQNQAFERLFGYSIEEIRGLHPAVVFASKSTAREVFDTIMAGDSWRGETEMLAKSGRHFPVSLHADAIKDVNGDVVGLIGIQRDITDRKRAEEALQKEKSFTEAILDSLPGTFFLLDSQGKQLRTNMSGLAASGYSMEELSQLHALDSLAEEDREAGQRALEDVFAKGDASLEAQMLTKDGRKIPFLYTAKKFIIDDIPYILGTGLDITERKQVEKALRESEERYRSLFHNNHAVMFLIDPDTGAIMDANPAACAFYGFSQEELLTKTTADLNTLPPDQVFQAMQKAKAEKQKSFQFQHRLASGEVREVEVFSGPIRIKGQDLLYSIVHDVTERKKAEEALRESEKRLKEAQEMAHLGFWYWNVKTGEVTWSEEVYKIFQLDPQEFTPHIDSILELSPWPGERERDQELIRKAMESHENGAYEQRFLLPDKSIGYYYSTFQGKYDEEGNLLSIVGTVLDITERKKAEEALRQSEKKYRHLYQDFQGILNTIPDTVCLLSPDLTIMWANQVPAIREDIPNISEIGKRCYPQRHGRFEPCEDCPVLRCFKSRKMETEVHAAHGKVWELRAFPIYDDQGELRGGLEIARDITEGKRMEEALRESQALYHDLVETAQDLIWQCDSEGRYTYLNPAWEEVFGYKIEEMLGKHFADFQPPEYAARDNQEFARLLEGNIVKGLETVHLAKDGRELHLVFNAKVVKDQDGHVSGTRGTAYNITERKLTEDALRESEKKYRSLYQEFQGILNAVPDILCLISPDLRIVWGNDATVLQIPDKKRSKIIGHHCYPFRHGRSAPCENCPVVRCFSSGKMETEEVVSFGDIYELRAVPLYDDHGGLRGAIEVARNITERKRMEEALEKRLVALSRPLDDARDIDFDDLFSLEEMQRLSDLFAKSTGTASLITAPDGTPITQPSNFCRLCSNFIRQTEQGRQRCAASDAALGRYNPDGPTIHHCLSAGLFGAGASISVGGKHIANWLIGQVRDETVNEENVRNYARELALDEEEFIAAFREVPIMSEAQFKLVAQALFIFANQLSAVAYQNVQQARFITERKRMEEALRDSERRLSEIIDFLPDATFAIDKEGKVITWNRAIEEMTGVLAKSIIGKGNYEYALPFYGVRRPKLIDLVLTPDEETEKQYALLQKRGDILLAEAEVELGGTMRLLWEKARPLYDNKGNIVGALEAIRDISERKRAEEEQAKLKEQMQEVQKLESLGVLAGGIAHDFNNLLMAILGNADLALLALSPASPAHPNVEQIIRASQRAADLCGQMLAYSGKGRFVVGHYDLSEIVREMSQMLQVSVSKKATLRYYFATGLPAVEVDVTQLRQVIMNLITNASESLGDQNGFISVSTGVMDCDRAYLAESYLDDHLPEGKYVYLEVADTGCGIDEETRRSIFDPFFTTKFTGRGLGLAAVLGIVRGHQGAIKVYSEVGHGTNFKVLLPAQEWVAGDRRPGEVQSAPTPPAGGTVLIIDDDPEVRDVGTQMLERLGFKVLTAAHGQGGLKIFQESQGGIDCVILDLTMPGMGGEEVFRELRRLRSDVRVILSSGYNEQEVTQRFAGKGLAGFIQKPYRVANLQEVLNRVFS